MPHTTIGLNNRKFGGYAPGEYECECECGCNFQGDKRSIRCPNCAIDYLLAKIKMYQESMHENMEEQLNTTLNMHGVGYVYQLKDKSTVVLKPENLVKYTKNLAIHTGE